MQTRYECCSFLPDGNHRTHSADGFLSMPAGTSPPLPPPSLPSATLRHPRRSAPAVGVLLEAHGGGLSCNRGRRCGISVVEKLPLIRAMREASNVHAFFGGSDSFAPLGVCRPAVSSNVDRDRRRIVSCLCVCPHVPASVRALSGLAATASSVGQPQRGRI